MTGGGRLAPALAQFLPRRRWYSGSTVPSTVEVVWHEQVKDLSPGLLRALVDADGACYQVLVGLRPADEFPDFLRGHDDNVIGELEAPGVDPFGPAPGSPALAYEATLDPELGLALLADVTGGRESAERVRPIGVEQSNSSLVYDDRLILKVFRRIRPGPNPEVEVTTALAELGFAHVTAPVATQVRDDCHLAVVQPYLLGGTEGWAMALTSLRDLFGVHDTRPMPRIDPDVPPPEPDPAEAGGDFSAEAERLGVVTAELHLAMAEAFGQHRADAGAWADDIAAQAAAVPAVDLDPVSARRVVDALRSTPDPGAAIRVHGDYHLGQVMRTDAGWFILDFEGEPARPIDERRRPTSALRDVAGMLRSFHYASIVALADRDEVGLAGAWEERNRRAFLDGYLTEAKKGSILPADERSLEAVLEAFELEKAVYELGYERAYRPELVGIPRAALRRLTERTPT